MEYSGYGDLIPNFLAHPQSQESRRDRYGVPRATVPRATQRLDSRLGLAYVDIGSGPMAVPGT